MTPEDAEELLDIFDAADRWIAEFTEFCNPADFGKGYGERLDRTSYRIYRWRQRLAPLAPADADNDQ